MSAVVAHKGHLVLSVLIEDLDGFGVDGQLALLNRGQSHHPPFFLQVLVADELRQPILFKPAEVGCEARGAIPAHSALAECDGGADGLVVVIGGDVDLVLVVAVP
jgi:hypothetical protein